MALPAQTLEAIPTSRSTEPRCRMCGAELERGTYCGALCEGDHALYMRALEREEGPAPKPSPKSALEPSPKTGAVARSMPEPIQRQPRKEQRKEEPKEQPKKAPEPAQLTFGLD